MCQQKNMHHSLRTSVELTSTIPLPMKPKRSSSLRSPLHKNPSLPHLRHLPLRFQTLCLFKFTKTAQIRHTFFPSLAHTLLSLRDSPTLQLLPTPPTTCNKTQATHPALHNASFKRNLTTHTHHMPPPHLQSRPSQSLIIHHPTRTTNTSPTH